MTSPKAILALAGRVLSVTLAFCASLFVAALDAIPLDVLQVIVAIAAVATVGVFVRQ